MSFSIHKSYFLCQVQFIFFGLPVLSVSYPVNHCQMKCLKVCSSSFYVMFRSLLLLVNFCRQGEIRMCVCLVVCVYPVFPMPFIEDCPFPMDWICHTLTIYIRVYYWAFCSIGLRVSTTQFDYCGFIVSFDIMK